jgi:hypothetical protein
VKQNDWLRKQRELYENPPEQSTIFSTHPISGKWTTSPYLKNQFWWGGGASIEAFEQLNNINDFKSVGVLVFGPVQSFLSGGKRLRDWATASWLCHYLTAVLIHKWEENGGRVLLPLYHNSPLVRWLNGEKVDENFWRAELPNVVTGLFPEELNWLGQSEKIITEHWSEFVKALERVATGKFHKLNGVGWKVIHRDKRYLWSVYCQGKPFVAENIIDDIQTLHQLLESKKIGRSWEGTWWPGWSSPTAGSLSIWHPGLRNVDDPNGTWGLPQDTLRQWWTSISSDERYGFLSSDESLNSLELIKRLASIPEVIEETLEELWGKKPPACPWENFPDRSAVAASWIANRVLPSQWNSQVNDLNEYIFGSSGTKIWGMPNMINQPEPYSHPHALERMNIPEDMLEDWQELVPKDWSSAIEWTVGWRGDGDNMGEWLSGKQFAKRNLNWQKWHPSAEIINEYNLSAPRVPDQPRVLEIPHVLDISILLNHWSNLLYPLTEQEHNGKVIFAGGDDFLLLGPLTEMVPLTSDLHHLWSGNKTSITTPLDPPLDGWTIHQDEIYPIPGMTMNFSLGVVIAQRRVPQSLWHRGLNEAYKKAKKLGRDRVFIKILFNSGQYLEWFCPWKLWHLLMSIEPDSLHNPDLNIWEKLLFYLESTNLQQSNIVKVKKLIDTLWASVGLPLSWEIINKVENIADYEKELESWKWWTDWIALRAFLARQKRERENWVESVNQVRR